MSSKGVALTAFVLGFAGMVSSTRATTGGNTPPVTYYKDVLPVLQRAKARIF